MDEPFAFFSELCQKFEYKLDPDMTIDIEEVMKENEAIAAYTIIFDRQKNIYNIGIVLKDFSRFTSHKFFWDFVNCIEYQDGMTFYCRRIFDECIKYSFCSVKSSELSVHCELNFRGK
ncbi:hypothetical protein ccbrp13_29960 [Ktedonobacteria bacterium brp13]|nr:hypothetical protein ccbrp13_29960 [Ktedonobacteria bacterium brp13]